MVQLFPTQVGGPTEYAKSRKWFFMAAVIFEGLMAFCAIVEFFYIIPGIAMCIAVFVAMVAWKENYNITYICWFGLLSFVSFWLGLVTAFTGFALTITSIVAKFNIPFSCAIGCLVAWWYYQDYETAYPCDDMFGYTCRQLGLLPPKPVPDKLKTFAGLAPSNIPTSSFGGLAALGGFGMAAGMGAGAIGSSVPVSWSKHWNELRDNEQRALLQLGYTEDTWENSVPQKFERTPWDRLTKDQQNALRVFQWSPAAWDMSLSGSNVVDQGKQAVHGAYGSLGSLGSLGDIAGAKQGNKDVMRDPFMTGV